MTEWLCRVRSLIFYLGYALITVVWGSISIAVAWALPYRARFHFIIGVWTRAVLFWLRTCCGIRHRVRGIENIPGKPCIVFCKHQSSWETFLLQLLFVPQAVVIKRELLWIPFFGWAFALLRPIALDRSKRAGALKQLIHQGRRRIEDGIWVSLLPEGTRVPVGQQGTFHRGGASLAHATGSPVVVVAHNAGWFWPARQFTKYPGVIDVEISPPLPSAGRSTNEISEAAAAWMEEAMSRLEPPAMHSVR